MEGGVWGKDKKDEWEWVIEQKKLIRKRSEL